MARSFDLLLNTANVLQALVQTQTATSGYDLEEEKNKIIFTNGARRAQWPCVFTNAKRQLYVSECTFYTMPSV